MAKLGEGDPRWLVEDREDGKNCNNWHWTEQDVTAWAKGRMEELFKDLALVNTASAKANLSGVEKIDGEVSVNTRKGKIFFFFELEIKLNWKGHLLVDGKESEEVKGLVHLPGISEENEDDFQINVSVEGAGKQNEQLKELVRTNTSGIRQKFAQFLKELRENKAPKLPPKKDSQILKSNSGAKAAPTENANANNNPSTGKAYNVPTKTLKMTIEFRAPAAQLYETLTNSGMVSAFTQSRAVISKDIGSEFVLFDGNITGKQIDLEQNKKIVQDWRFNSWPSGHFSRVTITFEEKSSGETTLKLSQTGVPESDAERTELGWKNFFWDRVKVLFGLEYKLV